MKQRGFTLLEVLVATTVMAVAVVGLLSALTTSMRNASRLTEHDRAALLARRTMDELLTTAQLPRLQVLQGVYDPHLTGGLKSGWRAQVTPFEMPPNPMPGVSILERIAVEVWWETGAQRRTFTLDGYRRAVLTQADIGGAIPR